MANVSNRFKIQVMLSDYSTHNYSNVRNYEMDDIGLGVEADDCSAFYVKEHIIAYKVWKEAEQ